jgi:DNA-nicking Smr family endonuclease
MAAGGAGFRRSGGGREEAAVGISKDDQRTFREATRGVKKIKPQDRVEFDRPRPAPRAQQRRAAQAAVLEESMSDWNFAQLGEEISFKRESVSAHTFRQLRLGRFSIEAEIDLHGLRRSEAKVVLQEFLTECARRELGCVRVIHGKGSRSGPDGPVLKASVASWLGYWDAVLAFVSATRRHGGSGAVYVLLKRH